MQPGIRVPARLRRRPGRTTTGALPARSVALIGGDGSGKSSVARRLVKDPTLHFTYMYMGPSWSSASHLLPSSRLILLLTRIRNRGGEQAPTTDSLEARNRPTSLPRFLIRSLLQFIEVVHRELRVRARLWRGVDVVCDRHILFEIWSVPDPSTSVDRARNAYARLLRITCRRPDLTLLLIADPEVMLERKGETDAAYLARRNQEWLDMADADPRIVVVDANAPFDDVWAQVIRALSDPPD